MELVENGYLQVGCSSRHINNMHARVNENSELSSDCYCSIDVLRLYFCDQLKDIHSIRVSGPQENLF